ncbi:hypothetical protein LQ327_26320 [Actinomycetospora endophytica]|uniref:Excreted virulence factor EspC (Type VII ESX diderm) n=1 Tax=Actinomycetospora endophytica TaxID=2291215 RepID=A0ABS8PF62_9PSEU|nr:hypothetical protein [Actinomycetospora endophytica]MCD2196891.1 hypothetical protein [Actinomycetospora endophytica]
MEQQALATVLRTLESASDAQGREPTPEPRELYGWGAALAAITDQLDGAVSVVSGEVARLESESELRDDMGTDPSERLQVAREQLESLRSALGAANSAARGFHASIGHVGRSFSRP